MALKSYRKRKNVLWAHVQRMGIRKNPTITYMTSAYFTIVMTAMMCSLAHTYVHSANQALARISAMVELCMHAVGISGRVAHPVLTHS